MLTAETSRFVEARRAHMSGPALDPKRTADLIEVAGGVPIYRKRISAQRSRQPDRLEVGRLVLREDASVWIVERVGPGCAEMRCLRGRRSGDVETTTTSASGFRYISEEDFESERAAAATARALERDESRCANCWNGDGVVDGADRGRDPNCRAHKPSPEALERAYGRRRRVETPEDVARVLELRGQGLSYMKIEDEMGWATHGSRAYKIVKDAEKKESA